MRHGTEGYPIKIPNSRGIVGVSDVDLSSVMQDIVVPVSVLHWFGGDCE